MKLALLAAALLQSPAAAADSLAAVDLHGLRRVPEAAVREAVGLRAGDPVPRSVDAIRARVAALPGVAEVDLSTVCCTPAGRSALHVGIRERGTPAATYRAAPGGAARLPAAMLAAAAAFDSALGPAVRRGATEEDGSQGYALNADPGLRAAQERFRRLAATGFDTLRTVLRTSADARHRAHAAQLIAYAPDRRLVAAELLHAVDDPDETVRNNAVRALGLLAAWAAEHPEAGVTVPARPFLRLLNSVTWSDRNKGSLAMLVISAGRDPALLAELRACALPSLVEMARWSNPGHNLAPFVILARLAGVEDGAAFEAWQRGEREPVIARAMAPPPPGGAAAPSC